MQSSRRLKIHLNIEVGNGLQRKKNIRRGKYKNKVTEPAINLTNKLENKTTFWLENKWKWKKQKISTGQESSADVSCVNRGLGIWYVRELLALRKYMEILQMKVELNGLCT
jgi:hypothetical protein